MTNWTETKFRVRYQETDQMGVVYHANYFIWFDIGRTEMIRKIGISYRQMEEQGLLLPLVNVSCQYKISAKYDDELIIRSRISKYNGLRMDFEYSVVRAEDLRLIATGITEHVWVNKDYKLVRLGKIKPSLHEKISEFVND